ncbi:MAG: quinone oxidoreductase [Pseudomonadota bacterium]
MSDETAIQIQATGDAECMMLVGKPMRALNSNEVIVRHEAIGVNFIDTYHRSGLYTVPLPSGIGLEAAGLIEAIGAEVSGLSVGDRVAYCSGPLGAYSTAHIIDADRAVRLPDAISVDVAAASLLKGLTVQYLIRQIFSCGPTHTVLFHAGAGGVGQIAVQWLKALGVHVIATAGGNEKCSLVRALGADLVIDYHHEDVAAAVRSFTDGQGVPVVFDGVGKDTWIGSLDSLQPRGLMVSFGNASGAVTGVDLGILAAKGSLFLTRPTLMTYTSTREALQKAADDYFCFLQDGSISITQPTEYALQDAHIAHTELESRRTTGSIILRP